MRASARVKVTLRARVWVSIRFRVCVMFRFRDRTRVSARDWTSDRVGLGLELGLESCLVIGLG